MQKLSIRAAVSFAFQAYINRPWDMFLVTLGVMLVYSGALLCAAAGLIFIAGVVPSVAISFLLAPVMPSFEVLGVTAIFVALVVMTLWIVSAILITPVLVLIADNIYHDRQDILRNIMPDFYTVLQVVGARLLTALGIFMGMLCLLIPGILFMVYSCFWTYGILLHNVSLSRTGLEYSGMLARDNYLKIILFVCVMGIVTTFLRFLPLMGTAIGLIIAESAWVHLYYQVRMQKNIGE